jgi:hypothetical protein
MTIDNDAEKIEPPREDELKKKSDLTKEKVIEPSYRKIMKAKLALRASVRLDSA